MSRAQNVAGIPVEMALPSAPAACPPCDRPASDQPAEKSKANANPFSLAASDPGNPPASMTSPAYSYTDHIKTPGELGMRADGSIGAIRDDLGGMVDYIQVLTSGGGNAIVGCSDNESGCTLGNRYFIKTAQKCVSKGEKVSRSLYIDNVPQGEMLGDGLVPGMLHNLEELNPFALIGSFMAGAVPACRPVTLKTGSFPNWGTGTGFVSDVDLQYVSACSFPDGKNPVSGSNCKEGFTQYASPFVPLPPKNRTVGVYHAAVAILGLYIACRLLEKEHSS